MRIARIESADTYFQLNELNLKNYETNANQIKFNESVRQIKQVQLDGVAGNGFNIEIIFCNITEI